MALAASVYREYVEWLRVHAPASHDNLAPPATAAELDALESVVGRELPSDVRDVLRVHNGQKATMTALRRVAAVPCLPTMSFLSTDLIAESWLEWEGLRREETAQGLAELQAMGGTFPGAGGRVKPLYTSPGWIPLWSDPMRADYIGLDLDPDAGGAAGQIINFGRDEEWHFVCAPTFAALLEILLDEVRSGAWEASQLRYGQQDLPWLGDPGESFFNALFKHSTRTEEQPTSRGS